MKRLAITPSSIMTSSIAATLLAASLFSITLHAGTAPNPVALHSLATSRADFCMQVQRRLVDTSLSMSSTIHQSKDDFTASKASVAPLDVQQFVERDPTGLIREISCKTKTADHLRAFHGATAARDPALPPRSCRDIQRDIVIDVWTTLGADARARVIHPPHRVMLDPDALSYTGSSWVGSSAEAYLAPDDKLHLRASALFAEWEDWRWKIMPKSFRGNHYCHLVAPERVRALMLGGERLVR